MEFLRDYWISQIKTDAKYPADFGRDYYQGLWVGSAVDMRPKEMRAQWMKTQLGEYAPGLPHAGGFVYLPCTRRSVWWVAAVA